MLEKEKLSSNKLQEIMKVGEETLEKALFLSEEDFKKLANPSYDLNKEEVVGEGELFEAYMNIIDLLKEYCDLKEEYYPLVSLWIIGTYMHEQFESYPYLFLNAMRGSGKTRTLKLITKLAKDGEVQASLTEAVLFRTQGTLGLDEFEGVSRAGGENLRELLNAAYKKGTKVKRMKQKKSPEGGTEQVVEEFSVYRPIAMANIWGMEEVLGDRCISLIIEKSSKKQITRKVEIYEHSPLFIKTKEILKKCSLCSVVTPLEVYIEWNKFVTNNYTSTHTIHYTNYTITLFNKLNNMDIDGRNLELTMPLLIIAMQISKDVLKTALDIVEVYVKEKKDDQFAESHDVSLIDFISQYTEQGWVRVQNLTKDFKGFLQAEEDDWVNSRWMGRALKRLSLLKEKRRIAGGVQVILNIEKALEKIKIFK